MRKFILTGVMLVVALAFAVGSIFAQEADETETESSAWLGVAIVEENEQVVIARVQTGSPANAADLLIGDVIVSFDGEAVEAASGLTDLVQAAAPGDTVTLEILRNGETINVDVTLGSTPARWGKGRGVFNLPVDALSAAELLLHVDLQDSDAGFEVVNVFAGRNPFDLEEGDVVTTINGQAVADLDVEALVTELTASDDAQLTVTITRNGEEVTLESDHFFGGRGPGRDGRGGRGGRSGGFDGLPDNSDTDAAPEAPSGDL